MKPDIAKELDHDGLRKNFIKYTRQAFQMLPALHRPCILDIGCGTGVPALELASLSDGEIFGIDIDEGALEHFSKKITEVGLQDRVKAVKCSLFDIKFPDESFDIVWAEGVIALIGFEKGLKEWRRLIKPNGYVCIHDDVDDIQQKTEAIPKHGYMIINTFAVPKAAWWDEYYRVLEKRIQKLRDKYRADADVLVLLDKEQHEIDMFKTEPKYDGSIFYVIQKS
jgi:ubiquinone/menaquinone biosynthesis C-methylase UbiE